VRCAKYLAPLAQPLVSPVAPPSRDNRQDAPVSDEVFEVYRSLYRYDRSPLEARIDSVSDRAEHYRVEWLSFAAPYGNERVPAVLYLPTDNAPPYQTVIFAPGAGAFIEQQRMGDAEGQREWFLFLVRSGRAVMVPMYKGTFERYVGKLDQPNTWRDIVIHASKDLGRSIDYLETRPEIDARRLAFYGLSAGGVVGEVLTAIEERFQASILMGSGLPSFPQPAEARSVNFLPRIRVPTLMINGRKDFFFPLGTAQEPMFRLLGAPPEHKRHRLFDSGHIPLEWQEVTREIHDWLDRYLGRVGKSE
jgi:pimeloyl-ACP methyl ester carboxylesterase